MYKFLMGLAVGYLTMTEDGKKITDDIIKKSSKEVKNYLEKEGVIETDRDARPPEHSEPSSEFQEQHSTDETVNQ